MFILTSFPTNYSFICLLYFEFGIEYQLEQGTNDTVIIFFKIAQC